MNVGMARPKSEWMNRREIKQVKIFKDSICGHTNIDDRVNSFLKDIDSYDVNNISTTVKDGYIVIAIEYKTRVQKND